MQLTTLLTVFVLPSALYRCILVRVGGMSNLLFLQQQQKRGVDRLFSVWKFEEIYYCWFVVSKLKIIVND